MVEPFRVTGRRTLLSTPIFEVCEHEATHPVSGRAGRFVVLDNPDWVNVIALTDAGELLLVRQFRHGIGAVALELPAGIVDPGEDAAVAAARELQEETGYGARRWTRLGQVIPNQAYQRNTCTTFLAEGAHAVADPDPIDAAEIEVVMVRPDGVPGMLARGELRNAMTVCAVFWWLQRCGAVDWGKVP